MRRRLLSAAFAISDITDVIDQGILLRRKKIRKPPSKVGMELSILTVLEFGFKGLEFDESFPSALVSGLSSSFIKGGKRRPPLEREGTTPLSEDKK